ncbi:hypothetical protein QFC20_005485 [Naganishia adeliensis]|uniref:Uncharacterized protein n=1 Tax=Naganishia adeliensis TaxID=92952 RepID=A0ACC2VPB9_9TREE|nr:hypothetical protein QFC20_005485 [Naganishia adeliensis]
MISFLFDKASLEDVSTAALRDTGFKNLFFIMLYLLPLELITQLVLQDDIEVHPNFMPTEAQIQVWTQHMFLDHPFNTFHFALSGVRNNDWETLHFLLRATGHEDTASSNAAPGHSHPPSLKVAFWKATEAEGQPEYTLYPLSVLALRHALDEAVAASRSAQLRFQAYERQLAEWMREFGDHIDVEQSAPVLWQSLHG